jgi:hypothetical protein
MNISNFLKFKKDSFASRNISKLCFDFWDRYFKVFFLLFSLAILFAGVYFWFQIAYRSDWNAEQKKQYQNSQNKEVELREQQFNKVVEEVNRKKDAYGKSIQAGRDIFASYFVEEPVKEGDAQSTKPLSTPASNVSENNVKSLP